MKLTTKMLKQIIQEELAAVMREEEEEQSTPETARNQGWADAEDGAVPNSEAFGDYADEYMEAYNAYMANVDSFHSHGDLGGW